MTLRLLLAPISFVILILSLGLPPVNAADAEQYWQLTISYDSSDVRVVEAAQIRAMKKKVRTPGLAGAPVIIEYELDWLDANGRTMMSTKTEVPLGLRTIPMADSVSRAYMPEHGTFVIRLEGPAGKLLPHSVRMTRVAVTRKMGAIDTPVPTVFDPATLVLIIENFYDASTDKEGEVGSSKIRDTGDDGGRLVIVYLGDGYTAADLAAGDYETHVNNGVSGFLVESPWDVLFGAINVYRVDIESNQQGADNEDGCGGTAKDTYLGAAFCYDGVTDRLLYINSLGRAITAANNAAGAGVWDEIVVLVNSTKYGGAGGQAAVTSVHTSANEILFHEFGHSFGELADEYESPWSGYNQNIPTQPNVDWNFGAPSLKWLVWVEPGTPLPTPELSAYAGVVGAFEGARYLDTGIYRPMLRCKMRTLGRSFCSICKEAHIDEFLQVVSLADDVDPIPGTGIFVTFTDPIFAIDPLPIPGLTYRWTLNGIVIADAISPDYSMSLSDMYDIGAVVASLQVTIEFESPLIRTVSVAESYSWTVTADCNNNSVSDSLDIATGTLFDLNLDGIPDECWIELCCRVRGDINHGDNGVDISDLVYLVDYMFTGGPGPPCIEEADIDGSSVIDISDLVYFVDYMFTGGPAPVACP